ncbi:MAG: 1-deoxy-D-xylulose-5-phosphate synthase [Bacteroidales bacterium]
MVIKTGELLNTIESSDDVKKVSEKQLPKLCKELRQYIIDVISQNPGHLGASLGVVELTVALHYVFNTPYDKLVWDVGHQAYGHKILTGRREAFMSNRKLHGLSGFPKMSESEYDSFGVGHSSTSISAVLGMAMAAKMQGDLNRQHIAVIGDGSMTGGMALEAINNAGVSDTNILIILNDNGISIDKSVGALDGYLTSIVTSPTYNRIKDITWKVLGRAGRPGADSQRFVSQVENAIKGSILQKSNLFESFNIRYFGPVDGNNVNKMVRVLAALKKIRGPKILHIKTTKGKGLEEAENHQTQYHAPGVFDPQTGKIIKNGVEGPKPPKYQEVFGNTIVELAEKNASIVGITPAMPSGCSLNIMMQKMPERAFDVGIAEQHAVTFAAGLASSGMTPFCNIYSSFTQRAYDQVIHDVALQNLPVIMCLDRGGLVGEDGPTHHGAYDMSMFRTIPNLTICAPMNEHELRNMMYTAQLIDEKRPYVIRYPRGRGVKVDWKNTFERISIGKGRCLRKGKTVAIVSIGHPGNFVAEALNRLEQKGIHVSHYDMRFLKPIDENLLLEACENHDTIITVEDGSIIGGLGSAVMEFASDHHYKNTVFRLGIPDEFIEHGKLEELHKICGFDTDSIEHYVEAIAMSGKVGVIRSMNPKERNSHLKKIQN